MRSMGASKSFGGLWEVTGGSGSSLGGSWNLLGTFERSLRATKRSFEAQERFSMGHICITFIVVASFGLNLF